MSTKQDKMREFISSLPIEEQNLISRFGFEYYKKWKKAQITTEEDPEIAQLEAKLEEIQNELTDFMELPRTDEELEQTRNLWTIFSSIILNIKNQNVMEGLIYTFKVSDGQLFFKLESKVVMASDDRQQKINDELEILNEALKNDPNNPSILEVRKILEGMLRKGTK